MFDDRTLSRHASLQRRTSTDRHASFTHAASGDDRQRDSRSTFRRTQHSLTCNAARQWAWDYGYTFRPPCCLYYDRTNVDDIFCPRTPVYPSWLYNLVHKPWKHLRRPIPASRFDLLFEAPQLRKERDGESEVRQSIGNTNHNEKSKGH